jgi:hypothetical protein
MARGSSIAISIEKASAQATAMASTITARDNAAAGASRGHFEVRLVEQHGRKSSGYQQPHNYSSVVGKGGLIRSGTACDVIHNGGVRAVNNR